MKPSFQTLVASILPPLVLLAVVEVVLRSSGADHPQFRTTLLSAGAEAVHREDDLLFFSMRPDLDVSWAGTPVVTNSLGLRSPPVGPKVEGEFRVLSLGESTTFGAFVEGDETYSARLELLLRERDPSRPYTVINAGVSAYSSFQSLVYLRERGLELEPDLVLFYHEVNDYLPSSIRSSAFIGRGSGQERDLAMTDIDLFESRRFRWRQAALRHLALARVIAHWRARDQIATPVTDDVFPDASGLAVPEGFQMVDTRKGLIRMNLPPRVTPEQRVRVLGELADLCEEKGIGLVVFHPSYAHSERHDCELTRFCKDRGVPMVEAYGVLHPPGLAQTTLFFDLYHPRPTGHEALAHAILDELVGSDLLPRRLLPEPRI